MSQIQIEDQELGLDSMGHHHATIPTLLLSEDLSEHFKQEQQRCPTASLDLFPDLTNCTNLITLTAAILSFSVQNLMQKMVYIPAKHEMF